MSFHEGIKNECDQCAYKATIKGNVKQHKMSVHEGIKYQCKHCIPLNSIGISGEFMFVV